MIFNASEERINYGQDIIIGEHTWVCQQVIILKGADIGNDSIVGTGSIVTNTKFSDNVIIGGTPAKVLKENVSWKPC